MDPQCLACRVNAGEEPLALRAAGLPDIEAAAHAADVLRRTFH
jgi:hypothetical protein